ncbi:hypothetical protein DERP_006747 [Dermatophagoides pteronyssinus]|uniref:GH18 domain-containing protein n=1 Tax=Dermatophagoides pteronyssinus TaxID=6956 RepID=A0ABQ8IRW6_DERPT|nr:hypothetical protein DERP_006747 [Dermatophagoides pteronyssinus]
MVLGLLTGSMPMLVSLLFMQGITLTMWRSFLDKAIPNLTNDKLRKSFQQIMPPQSSSTNSLNSIHQSPSSIDQLSLLINNNNNNNNNDQSHATSASSSSSSVMMNKESNSITDSLQLLANLDPRIVQLLSQVGSVNPTQQSQQQSQSTSLPSSTIDQMNVLNSLTTLLRSAATSPTIQPNHLLPSLLQNSPENNQYIQQQQHQQQQYTPIIDPNDPNIKYYEVSSQHQPGIDDQRLQYEQPYDIHYVKDGDDNNLKETVKYDYLNPLKQSSEPLMEDDEPEEDEEIEKKRKNSDLYEEVDYDEDDDDDGVDNGNEANEEENDELEEDYDDNDIDDNSKASIRNRISPKRMFAATKNKIQNLRRKSISRHRLTKRMIKFDLTPLQYAQNRLKEKFKNSFPFLRRNSDTVRNRKPVIKNKIKIEQKRIRDDRKISTSQNRRPSPNQSWRRTTERQKDNFRFATPKVPILSNDNDADDKDNDDDGNDEKKDSIKNEKPRKNKKRIEKPIKKQMKTKTTIGLSPKKIQVSSDIDEFEANFCNVTLNKIKTNKKFGEIWSKKNGWSRCHPKSPNFRLSKGIVIPAINIESPIDLSTTTTSPEGLEESTLPVTEEESDNNDNDEDDVPSDLELTTTEEYEQETTSILTDMKTESDIDDDMPTTTQLTFPINSDFLANFNSFLATLESNTTIPPLFLSSLSPPSTTTTTTTTMSPWNKNLVDEIPKEFFWHILKVINASKIDNYQVNPMDNLNNHNLNAIKSTSITDESFETHLNKNNDEDEDDDNDSDDNKTAPEEINEELLHQIKDDNRIDGKILVAHRFKRVCYLLLNVGKDGHIEMNQLELHICSHLIVGYARISTNGLVVAQKPLEDTERYRRATMMKLQYPKLKVMLSIGDLGGAMFSIVTSTNRTRERFIISILDICTEFNFDGIDIDWEFPGFRTPGLSSDKQNLVLFLKDLRKMAKLVWQNDINQGSFIVSLAVGAPLMIASTSYIIPEIGKFVDFVNLMSYDFHYYRPDKPYTGHHSPLYPRSNDNAYFSTLNVAWTATYWANSGMPLRKIMIGVPTYARTYNLVVPIGQNMINVPASGPGIGKGKMNYTHVCEFLRLPGTIKHFDFHSQVPYAYNGFDWIAYENELSVATKAQWVVKTGMGGIVTFALNFDDTKGICRDDGKRFPLQKTISNVLELAQEFRYFSRKYADA